MNKFRVIDLRSGVIEPEHMVDALSPELAALQALGEKGVRGGQNRSRLFCRVYWQDSAGQTNMVRLYRPLWEAAEPSSGDGVVSSA
ncbi:MAG: hypothetical protein ABW043_02795 [Devosia sp.]|uniref:hypothetical protein n=1 Tax=Devosia sp. TaxID=1871048 RepID=UPI00339A2428